MAKPKFRRTDGHKYSKLGVRRKKLQKYKKPKGIDNKIRLNRAGRLRKVKIGFRSEKKVRGFEKKPIMIYNINNLKNIKEGVVGVVGRIGNKKKVEIAKYAKEKNIQLLNLDSEKFLKKIEDKMEKAKVEKKKIEEKKKARDKKAKEKEDKEEAKRKKEEKKDKKLEEKVEEKTEKKDEKNIDKIKKDKRSEQISESSQNSQKVANLDINNKLDEEEDD